MLRCRSPLQKRLLFGTVDKAFISKSDSENPVFKRVLKSQFRQKGTFSTVPVLQTCSSRSLLGQLSEDVDGYAARQADRLLSDGIRQGEVRPNQRLKWFPVSSVIPIK